MKTPKSINLYYKGSPREVPFLPFISGSKKIELEAIIPKYMKIEQETLQKDYDRIKKEMDSLSEDKVIDSVNKIVADAETTLANRRANINYDIYSGDLQSLQINIAKGQIDVHKDSIHLDYIKAMLDYNKIKDAGLLEALQSSNNSEFWLEQDALYLGEVGNSFRRCII